MDRPPADALGAVVLPLIMPIIVTVSVLQFFAIYGDFVIASVL
jgi:ABC-type maltose transport system permease subunit